MNTAATREFEIASALDETGYEWSHPQDEPNQWHTLAIGPGGHRCELTVQIVASGVEVRSQLLDWQGGWGEISQAAVARFLAAATGQLRPVRFTLGNSSASVASVASTGQLEVELPDSVAAVLRASRLVRHELRALMDDNVARTYLQVTD